MKLTKFLVLFLSLIAVVWFIAGCSNDDDEKHTVCDFDNWVITKAATCVSGGEETGTCGVCGENQTRPIAATGHKHSEERQITRAANCTENGERAKVCSTCGDKIDLEVVLALGHDLSEWEITQAVICGGADGGGKDGEEKRVCERENCEHSEKRAILSANHNWGTLEEVLAATCETEGRRARVCSICGEENSPQAISALGHNLGAWTEKRAAVCDEDGEEERLCTRENCEHSETRAIPTDCFTISTAGELADFRDRVNAGETFQGKTIKLLNDIQLQGQWIPIGEFSSTAANNRPFRGIFDGNNKKISGLSINNPTSNNQGFFGNIGANAIVKNLGLVNVNVVGGNNTGGLAGVNNGRIENTYVTGVISGNTDVGGLVGSVGGEVHSSFSSATVSGVLSVGGLVGAITNNGFVGNSYARGSVSSTGAGGNVGGLVGSNSGSGGRITNNYATGRVTGNNFLLRTDGGLVGGGTPSGVTNSFFDLETTGQTRNGTPKTTAEMKQQETFVEWDFVNVWGIDPAFNDGYPYLRALRPFMP